jgi:hypothetical protein
MPRDQQKAGGYERLGTRGDERWRAKNQELWGGSFQALGQEPLTAKTAKNWRQGREESTAQISEEFFATIQKDARDFLLGSSSVTS